MGGSSGRDRVNTLICLGFGYSAQHYVALHGARFDRIVGTTRSTANAAELAGRRFGGRKVEMIVFDGETADPALVEAVSQASVLLVSISPADGIDPTLARLDDAIVAAPQLASIVYLSTIAVYGNHDGAWIDEETPLTPALTRALTRACPAGSRRRHRRRRGMKQGGDRRGEVLPGSALGVEGPPARRGQLVDAPAAAARFRPARLNQARPLQPVQGRVHRPGGQVDLTAAAYSQRLHDRVTVTRTRLQNRQQNSVQMTLQRFRPHV